MRRTILALAAFALIAGTPQHVTAGEPPSGTISCTALGQLMYGPPYLPTGPTTEPLTKPLRVGGRSESSTCDASGVVGGRLPIITVDARLNGKFAPGTSCADFLGTLSLTGKVKLRWLGNKLGNYVTVGSSRATIASAAYDDGTEAWVVVTNPIKSGAFKGATVTLHFNFINPANYANTCATSTLRFAGWTFGPDHPLLIDVQ